MAKDPEPVVAIFTKGDGLTKTFKQHPQLVVSLMLVVVVVILVIFANAGKPKYSPAVSLSNVCSTGLINDSVSNFNNPDITKLASDVSSIQKLPNYQQDPNCMYVVTLYYVDALNYSKASSSLNLFNKYYSSQNLNPQLSRYASVKLLRQYVSNLNQRFEQEQRNSFALSPRPVGSTKVSK